MGSTILNPMDIYPRLKAFKTLIQQNGWQDRKLYFVKLDIKACFDTIPQRKLLQLVENMLIEDEYRIEFHAEIKPADYYGRNGLSGSKAKVFRRFLKEARGEDDFEPFEDLVLKNSEAKRNVVFVDKGYKRYHNRQEILGLLKEHVQRNTVKVGFNRITFTLVFLTFTRSAINSIAKKRVYHRVLCFLRSLVVSYMAP